MVTSSCKIQLDGLDSTISRHKDLAICVKGAVLHEMVLEAAPLPEVPPKKSAMFGQLYDPRVPPPRPLTLPWLLLSPWLAFKHFLLRLFPSGNLFQRKSASLKLATAGNMQFHAVSMVCKPSPLKRETH